MLKAGNWKIPLLGLAVVVLGTAIAGAAVTRQTVRGKLEATQEESDTKGKFRVVVRPDPTEPDWPAQRFLRQGARANGWVLLNEVRLGYELWRQLNGFPPAVDPPKDAKGQLMAGAPKKDK